MKIKTFLKRLANKSIKFRGRDFLYFLYEDGKSYKFCIEHLIQEPNDLLVYTETIEYENRSKEIIDSSQKQKVITALLEELRTLDYKFIIDSSIPPKFL